MMCFPSRTRLSALLAPLLLSGCQQVLVHDVTPAPAGALRVGAVRAGADVAAQLPLVFVENRGQWPPAVAFAARSGGLAAQVERDGLVLHLLSAAGALSAAGVLSATGAHPAAGAAGAQLSLRFEGASPEAVVRGEGAPRSRVHLYHGAQPAGWQEDIGAWSAVRFVQLYPGIDVALRDGGGHLEYDLLLAPGARLADVVVRVDGAEALSLEADGTLVAQTGCGPLRQSAPVTWQVRPDGTREPLEAAVRLLDERRFGFEAPDRDAALALVVDPGLSYATYLGGSNWDHVTAVARGPDGHAWLAGYTTSLNFPATPGTAQPALAGYGDAFVAKLDLASGALLWATYLGGNDGVIFVEESARALALDAGGAAWIVGAANSPDFPVTAGALQPASAGGTDAFVARLAADGTLALSTYLGGARDDLASGVALTGSGVLVAGRTFSDGGGGAAPFPTTAGAFDTSFNSIFFTDDAFVAKLAPDGGSLLWSTLLGGVLRDEALAIAADASGAAFVTGLTGSNNFPVTPGALDTSFNGASANQLDAFVCKLAPAGNALVWSSYLGGAQSEEGRALALGSDGRVLVAGVTASTDFPGTPGAAQAGFAGGATDAFVARVAADGSALLWASALGGSGDDSAAALALDAADAPTLAGSTTSADFPVTPGAVGSGNAGQSDAFVARLSADGSVLRYGGTFGGAAEDRADALALDVHGAALLAGETASGNLPMTASAFDATSNGGGDAFFARVTLPPWNNLGKGLAGTAGKVPLLVGTGSLVPGTPGALTLSNARPNSLMFLFAGFSAGNVPFKGGTLVPFPVSISIQLVTLANGGFPLAFAAWPAGLPAGFPVYFQEWVADSGAPGGASASNALQATQP